MKQVTISQSITKREADSFKLYLKNIAEIGLLTPEEEIICTEKASRGDKAAIKELIEKNLRFVVSVAKQYVDKNNSIEDLVNEGNIGLMIAVDRFKPSMGYKFISYAVWWISKIILEHLAKHGKMVRLPANQINGVSKLNKRISLLEQQLGRNVDITEVIDSYSAEMESLTDDQLKAIQKDVYLLENLSTSTTDSLDREINYDADGSHATLADILADDSANETDYLVTSQNIKHEIKNILSTLKPRDRKIMEDLFGLSGSQPMTLNEIGDEIGLSREMVRQIKEKTLKSLRHKLRNSSIRCSQ